MMTDLSTYRVSDFLLFSRDVYYGLFETYNQEIWPLQILFVFISMTILFFLLRKTAMSSRILAILLAFVWSWVGIVFHLKYFTTINWSAKYNGWLFLVEALLFFFAGIFSKRIFKRVRSNLIFTIGMFIFVLAAFVPVSLVMTTNIHEVQLFGWGADATAVGTVGMIIACTDNWKAKLLIIIPLLMSVMSFLTYYGLK